MPAGGHADLALVEERPPGTDARGLLDVLVLEDEQGTVAAELEVHPLEMLGSERATRRPAPVEPVKAMTRTSRWITRASPTSLPPGSTLSTPRGQPCLLEDAGQRDAAADRGARVGLEHHRVAQRQRRRDGPDREDQREVEGRDHADHTHRHTPGQAETRLVRAQQLAVRVRG